MHALDTIYTDIADIVSLLVNELYSDYSCSLISMTWAIRMYCFYARLNNINITLTRCTQRKFIQPIQCVYVVACVRYCTQFSE